MGKCIITRRGEGFVHGFAQLQSTERQLIIPEIAGKENIQIAYSTNGGFYSVDFVFSINKETGEQNAIGYFSTNLGVISQVNVQYDATTGKFTLTDTSKSFFTTGYTGLYEYFGW